MPAVLPFPSQHVPSCDEDEIDGLMAEILGFEAEREYRRWYMTELPCRIAPARAEASDKVSGASLAAA